MLLLLSAYFFQNSLYLKKKKNAFRVSNDLDPNQAGHFVGLDLGSKLFAKIISRGQKSQLARRVKFGCDAVYEEVQCGIQ